MKTIRCPVSSFPIRTKPNGDKYWVDYDGTERPMPTDITDAELKFAECIKEDELGRYVELIIE